jgi:hypothetical protein
MGDCVMHHHDTPTTIRAALLALYVFLCAWAASGFTATAEAVGLSAIAALGGWLNPAKPETDTE